MTKKMTLEQRVAHLEAVTSCLLDHQGDVACVIELAGRKMWEKFGESLTVHLEDAKQKPKKKSPKRGGK